MSAQPVEEQTLGDLLLPKALKVYDQVLKPIDGIRGTWSWMLEDGNKGFGIVPFIVDVDWWDQTGRTSDMTKDQPEVLPAFVTWEAPSASLYNHVGHAMPVVEITGGSWLTDDCYYPVMGQQNWWFDEECYYQNDNLISFSPVWSVTPIDQDSYVQWAEAFESKRKLVDTLLLESIVLNQEGYHLEYYDEHDQLQECDGYPLALGEKCPCGLEEAQEQVTRAIYDKKWWTNPGLEFENVWKWTINRWLDGWQAINTTALSKEDPFCLYSSASLLSPYFRTLRSDVLAREKERLSLTHSTSSPQWQESLTEPSPQLTLFDT